MADDDRSRPVPHHGSGGALLPRGATVRSYASADPDDTEGRALYRKVAEQDASLGRRRVWLETTAAPSEAKRGDEQGGK